MTQIPTEAEPKHTAALQQQQQQQQQPSCLRKRLRTVEQDQIDESLTPPEKAIRLHEFIAIESMKDNGDFIDVSKLASTRDDVLSAYKRIWSNLDLREPRDAKLEPFIWQQIRHYQQRSLN